MYPTERPRIQTLSVCFLILDHTTGNVLQHINLPIGVRHIAEHLHNPDRIAPTRFPQLGQSHVEAPPFVIGQAEQPVFQRCIRPGLLRAAKLGEIDAVEVLLQPISDERAVVVVHSAHGRQVSA